MNKKLEEWKLRIDQQKIPVDKLDQAIKAGIDKGFKQQKSAKWKKRSVSAVVAIFLVTGTLFGFAYLSQPVAKAFENVPIIGSIMAQFHEDPGAKKAVERGAKQTILASVTEHNITFTIHELIYDGIRLVVSYSIEGDHLEPIVEDDQLSLMYNDERIDVGGATKIGNFVNENRFEGMWSYGMGHIDLDGKEIFIYFASGKVFPETIWLVKNVPIVKTDKFDTITELKPLKTDDFTFQVKEMNFSPATTQIIWYIDPANPIKPEELGYDMQLVDQKGRVYKKISQRGGSRDGGPVIHHSSFEPLYSSTKTLYLIPYDRSENINKYDDLQKSLLEKLPAIEVPLTGKLKNMHK